MAYFNKLIVLFRRGDLLMGKPVPQIGMGRAWVDLDAVASLDGDEGHSKDPASGGGLLLRGSSETCGFLWEWLRCAGPDAWVIVHVGPPVCATGRGLQEQWT